MQPCDKIQPGILFILLQTEGRKLRFVTEPARDKKYAIIAYSRMLAETVQVCPPETHREAQREVVCGLLELNASRPSFRVASIAAKSAVEMLSSGTIDQTFAFDRQAFVQLFGAQMALTDKRFENQDAAGYLTVALQLMCRKANSSIKNYLLEEKHSEMLDDLRILTGIKIN